MRIESKSVAEKNRKDEEGDRAVLKRRWKKDGMRREWDRMMWKGMNEKNRKSDE